MRTRLIAGGRVGRYEMKPTWFFPGWTCRIEPWGPLYYVFTGCGLPLLLERVVGEYCGYRVRATVGNRRDAQAFWVQTAKLWEPVIDWVRESGMSPFLGFRYHPCRIEWHWVMQFGYSSIENKNRANELAKRFDVLGAALEEIVWQNPPQPHNVEIVDYH